MTDWYIDQMKAKAHDSDPMPISFTHDQYVQGTRDYMFFDKKTDNRWGVKDFIDFIASSDPRTKVELRNGHSVNYYPTNKLRLTVDRNAVIQNKVVPPALYDSIVPYIDIDIKGDALYKNRLMMLDIVYNNNWKRPIYFTGGSFGDDDYLWMKDYLQLDGMVYKLMPVRTPIPKDGSPLDMGNIDTDKMYDIVMKWDWGNSESPKIYHDPETRKNSITYRTNLARLTEKLLQEGKKEKAKKIVDLAMTKMPVEYFEYYTLLEPYASAYYQLNETKEARQLLDKLIKKYQENLTYMKGLTISEQNDVAIDIVTDIERYRSLLLIMKDHGDEAYYNKAKVVFNQYNKMFERFKRDKE
jgi:tetratricopeptide (TPR) repeat protein